MPKPLKLIQLLLFAPYLILARQCPPEYVKPLQEKAQNKRLENIENFEKLCDCDDMTKCLEGGILLSIAGLNNESKIFYEKGCKLKSDIACRLLTNLANPKTAAQLNQECIKGEGVSCLMLGQSEVAANRIEVAKTHLRMACDKKISESCLFESILNSQTNLKGNAPPPVAATPPPQKGQAPNPNVVPKSGLVVPPPPPKPNPNAAKIIPPPSTNASAKAPLTPEAQMKTDSEAYEKNKIACNKGNAMYCLYAGRYALILKKTGEARNLFIQACELRVNDGCVALQNLAQPPAKTAAPVKKL